MQDAILPPVANRRWSAIVQSTGGRVNNPPLDFGPSLDKTTFL